MNPSRTTNYALIVAFGDLKRSDGAIVSSTRIEDGLLSQSRWYTTFNPRVPSGTNVLFYKNRFGIVARARIREVVPATSGDIVASLGFAAPWFTYKMILTDVVRVTKPIPLGNFVNELAFITNKSYWGGSLRRTPRKISHADFVHIIDTGKRLDSW